MTDTPHTKPRIYADFNSCMEDSRGMWCWMLRYNGVILDEAVEALGAYEGMPVVLYDQDETTHFEVDAILGHMNVPGWEHMWAGLIVGETRQLE